MKLATDALEEYLALVRETPEYLGSSKYIDLGTVRDEIKLQMETMEWFEGNWYPGNNPDNVYSLGSGIPVWGPEGCTHMLKLDGIFHMRSWDGWRVEHSLSFDGTGSVWAKQGLTNQTETNKLNTYINELIQMYPWKTVNERNVIRPDGVISKTLPPYKFK